MRFVQLLILIYINPSDGESIRDNILRELTDPIVLRTIADLLATKIEHGDIPG